MARLRTSGRRGIEMKLIPSQRNRWVSFSKRQSGLFKKANELCILTGCQVALVIFSERNRAYSFGHPSVDAVVKHYLDKSQVPVALPTGDTVASRLNQQYAEICKQLQREKNKAKELDESLMNGLMGLSLNALKNELSLDQLIKAKERVEQLSEKIEDIIAQNSRGGPGSSSSHQSHGCSQKKIIRDFDLNVTPNGDEM